MAARPPRIPSSIVAGPHRYRVAVDELERLRTMRTEGANLFGHSDHARLVIEVDTTLAPSAVRETLFHEILHVLADVSGLSEEWGKDGEEKIVRRLSPLILDTLRRNPTLVPFLLADEIAP